jgi:transposase-like protein
MRRRSRRQGPRRTHLGSLVRTFPERAIRVIANMLASIGSFERAALTLGVSQPTLRNYRRQLGEERVWALALEIMRGRGSTQVAFGSSLKSAQTGTP